MRLRNLMDQLKITKSITKSLRKRFVTNRWTTHLHPGRASVLMAVLFLLLLLVPLVQAQSSNGHPTSATREQVKAAMHARNMAAFNSPGPYKGPGRQIFTYNDDGTTKSSLIVLEGKDTVQRAHTKMAKQAPAGKPLKVGVFGQVGSKVWLDSERNRRNDPSWNGFVTRSEVIETTAVQKRPDGMYQAMGKEAQWYSDGTSNVRTIVWGPWPSVPAWVKQR